LEVADWKILSKNMRPIPTEYYGLKDTEELLRKRYLDMMMNAETRELFQKKNIFGNRSGIFCLEMDFWKYKTRFWSLLRVERMPNRLLRITMLWIRIILCEFLWSCLLSVFGGRL